MYVRPRLGHMLCQLRHDKQLAFPFLCRRFRRRGHDPARHEIEQDRSEILDAQLGQSGDTKHAREPLEDPSGVERRPRARVTECKVERVPRDVLGSIRGGTDTDLFKESCNLSLEIEPGDVSAGVRDGCWRCRIVDEHDGRRVGFVDVRVEVNDVDLHRLRHGGQSGDGLVVVCKADDREMDSTLTLLE